MIRGFLFDSIEAKRFVLPDKMPRELRIDNRSDLRNVIIKGDDAIEVEFVYTATYAGVGVISIEGRVLYEKRGEARAIYEEWLANRKLREEVAMEIQGAIINNCIAEAIFLAKELKMPPPIPPPVRMGTPPKKGKGKKGDMLGYV
jgi:hypothetical protein